MPAKEESVRKMIIPDISVKILDLCLSDGENGISAVTTQRESGVSDYRCDSVLQEVISLRITEGYKALPLTLRKRKIYEDTLKEQKELLQNCIDNMLQNGIAPIILRKHLLCKHSMAG